MVIIFHAKIFHSKIISKMHSARGSPYRSLFFYYIISALSVYKIPLAQIFHRHTLSSFFKLYRYMIECFILSMQLEYKQWKNIKDETDCCRARKWKKNEMRRILFCVMWWVKCAFSFIRTRIFFAWSLHVCWHEIHISSRARIKRNREKISSTAACYASMHGYKTSLSREFVYLRWESPFTYANVILPGIFELHTAFNKKIGEIFPSHDFIFGWRCFSCQAIKQLGRVCQDKSE